MIRKFGSREAFEKVKASHGLVPRAAEVGLDASVGFTQDNLTRRRQSSTLNAHRLVYYVSQKYSTLKAEELYSLLNRKHFIEGGILNDRNLLLDAVKEVDNLDVDDCVAFLDSNKGSEEVKRTVDMVHSLGIHSIPTLIVNGKYILNGAVRSEEVYGVLERAVNDMYDNNVVINKRLFGEVLEYD